MLSFSNFGSVDHPLARKVRRATALARERNPGLVIEGELQLETALDGEIRRRYFPFSDLTQNANVLIFPDLQSGNLALQLLQKLGDAMAVGPILVGDAPPGARHPVRLAGRRRGEPRGDRGAAVRGGAEWGGVGLNPSAIRPWAGDRSSARLRLAENGISKHIRRQVLAEAISP